MKHRSYYFWLIVKSIRYCRYFPQMIPAMIFYLLIRKNTKNILKEDIDRFYAIEYGGNKNSYFTAFYRLMVEYPAFRNVYYCRLSYFGDMISWFIPKWKTLAIRTRTQNIGGGLYIQHGTSTRILAHKIGKNLFINQNATIGWSGTGFPTIGNNVRIGAGAVVVGPITIGDNVKIGANATVTKDIPSNVTVVSPHAYICKRDGKRTFEPISGSIYDQLTK